MSTLFSRACEYGIRTMLYLASHTGNGPILVRDIAEALDIPFPFLAKIVQTLGRQGLINSIKGRGGGIALGRPPGEIALLEVVEAIDGVDLSQRCVLGLPECSGDAPCPLHGQWGDIREGIVNMLSNQSLAIFADQMRAQDAVPVSSLIENA